MKKETYLSYAQQSISREDVAAVTKALKEPIITRGPQVKAFEEAIAEYCGAKYAVAFNSGTSALAAAYFAIDTTHQDRIITTPNTFVGTLSGALHNDATPLFVDIDPETGNFDLDALQSTMNRPSTRGRDIIVPVHFAGISVDVEHINRMVSQPDTVIIEDAAHALGSHYPDGSKVGGCQWSDMTVFCFHPTKTITTMEGGMVTVNDEKLYRRLQLFRNNGIERDPSHLPETPGPWYYEVQTITGNYNYTDVQAALGLSQLKRLDKFVTKRHQLIKKYRTHLEGQEQITLLEGAKEKFSAHHLCVALIDFEACKTTRSEVMQQLHEAGIGTQVHYIPLYRHPYFFNRYGDKSEEFPKMEEYYTKALSLPLHANLKDKDIDKIVTSLKKALNP